MNLENVNKAIVIMERVKARNDRLYMGSFQDRVGVNEHYAHDEHTLRKCGNTACFAGWVAVAPEFVSDGGAPGPRGSPSIKDYTGGHAIASWLGISHADAAAVVYGEEHPVLEDVTLAEFTSSGREWEEWTADDVLEVLYRLRDTGSVWPAHVLGELADLEEAD